MRCQKARVGLTLNVTCQIKFISRNICLSCNALSVYAQLCQNKQQEQGFQDVVNTNKIKFEPYLDLVDQHFLNSTRNQLTIKDQYCQKKKR